MDMITTQGLRMPRLGLGTWPMKSGECQRAVEQALTLGYRHIDTAQSYGNEDAVGAGLAAAGLPRGEVHVTTKVWWDNLRPEAIRRTLEQALAALRTEYVDLFLIHWPAPDMDLGAALGEMVRLKEEGRARAIGVSNFPVALLRRAVEEVRAPVAVNQVEYHVMLDQTKVLAYARSKGIAVTAYSPIARSAVSEQPEMQRIAKKHGATPAQVALRWLLDQDGVAAIPKAQSRANQQANMDTLKLRLDDEDRAAIARLPKDRRMVDPAFAPEWDRPGA